MNAICRNCCDRLHELLDESLSGDGVLRELRAHLDACPDCQADLNILRAARSELLALPKAAAPVELRAAVLHELRRPAAPGFWASLLARPTRLAWAGGALATACFLVIIARSPEVSRQEFAALPTAEPQSNKLAREGDAPSFDVAQRSAKAGATPPAGAAMAGNAQSAKMGAAPPVPDVTMAKSADRKPVPAAKIVEKRANLLDAAVSPVRRAGQLGEKELVARTDVAGQPVKMKRDTALPAAPIPPPVPALASEPSRFAVAPHVETSGGGAGGALDANVTQRPESTGTVRSAAPPITSPAAAPAEAFAGGLSADAAGGGAKPAPGGFGAGLADGAPRGSAAMMGKSAPGKNGLDGKTGNDGRRGVESLNAVNQNAAKPADKAALHTVLTVGAARELTVQLTPSADGSEVQLRLTLPEKVRFADGDNTKIVWHGDAKRGVPVLANVKVLANVTGTQTLRLTLEKPGADPAVLQTQTLEIVVVP